MKKYTKFWWGNPKKYVIGQLLDELGPEVQKRIGTPEGEDPKEFITSEYGERVWMKILYGSTCGYTKVGNIEYIKKTLDLQMEDLDTDQVVKDHFVGLL